MALACAIALYLLGGLLIQLARCKRGSELLPNLEFWKAFFGAVAVSSFFHFFVYLERERDLERVSVCVCVCACVPAREVNEENQGGDCWCGKNMLLKAFDFFAAGSRMGWPSPFAASLLLRRQPTKSVRGNFQSPR